MSAEIKRIQYPIGWEKACSVWREAKGEKGEVAAKDKSRTHKETCAAYDMSVPEIG